MMKMSKILIKVNNEKDFICPADGYILGLEKFSICFNLRFDFDELIELRKKYSDKKLFISLNRVIYNGELEEYKGILYKLDKYNFDGFIVGDKAALTYDLKTNVILDELHLNNSYKTINHYEKNGVSGIVLTNDIPYSDINIIRQNTPCLLFKQVFGYVHLSTSVRTLASNYLKYFNIDNYSKSYFIKEQNSDDYYRVVEDSFGTHILSNKVLNLFNFVDDINVDYFIIDSYFLDDVSLVFDAFLNKDKILNDKINETLDTFDGFINKKTIYKVKNYD